jgi:hypothetical protein
MDRLTNPLKRWKLSYEDFRNRSRWANYEVAIEDMLEKTSLKRAPSAHSASRNQGQRLSLSRPFARVFCALADPAVFHGAMANITLPSGAVHNLIIGGVFFRLTEETKIQAK